MFNNIDSKYLNSLYHDKLIPKKNGKFRKISAPSKELKQEQWRILEEYLEPMNPGKFSYGFVKNVSIKDNAKQHVNNTVIMEMDLKDFFDTITLDMVYKALIDNGMEHDKAHYISHVCTKKGRTPQGAPTSPYLSNLVCKGMDRKISRLCSQYGINYTRYADDLTFSSLEKDAYDLFMKIRPEIISIVTARGLKVNKNKNRIVKKHYRQSVTGVSVNQKINLSRKKIKDLDNRLYCLEKELANKNPRPVKELEKKYGSIDSLLGYANFVCQIKPEEGAELFQRAKTISKKMKNKVKNEVDLINEPML